MRAAVIVDVVRTASGKGKPGGALSGTHPAELLAQVLQRLVERTGVDPATIDDVIAGCVGQVGEQSFNIGRQAILGADWPESVPATTIDRQCGSSQQALHFAAQGVQAGAYGIVVACGVESMSRVPMGSSVAGADPYGPGVARRYPDGLVGQGVSAELIAQRWRLSRAQLDDFAAQSHQRAADTAAAGAFRAEIIAVDVVGADGPVRHATDETVRAGTSAQGLAGLKAAFASPEMVERFPDLDWKITAGNSSPLTDGASAALIMGQDVAERLGLRPRARFHAFAVLGDDPVMMLTGPIPATAKVL